MEGFEVQYRDLERGIGEDVGELASVYLTAHLRSESPLSVRRLHTAAQLL